MAKLKLKYNNSVYSVTDDTVRDAQISAITDVYGAKNLLNYNDLSSQTIHGVDVIVNSDKSITANGTNDGTLTVLLLTSNLYLPVGTYIFSDGGYSTQFGGQVFMQMGIYAGGGVGNTSRGDFTFTVSDPNTRYVVELVIAGGKTLAGTFYPMIRDARITDPTYVPYSMTNKELTDEVANIGKYRKYSPGWFSPNQTWQTGITETCTCLISLQGYDSYSTGLILAQKFSNGLTYVGKLISAEHFNVTFVNGEMQCSTDSVSQGVFNILFLNERG